MVVCIVRKYKIGWVCSKSGAYISDFIIYGQYGNDVVYMIALFGIDAGLAVTTQSDEGKRDPRLERDDTKGQSAVDTLDQVRTLKDGFVASSLALCHNLSVAWCKSFIG